MGTLATAAGANVPQVFRQVFPDAAARTGDATVYKSTDVNKIGFQIDTKEQYRLASIGPTVWDLITGTGTADLVPLWKGGTPGNLFIDGDTANPAFGQRVMMTIVGTDTLTINLPQVSTGIPGSRVGVQDRTFAAKNMGVISLVPGDAGDSIGGHPAGATRKPVSGNIGPWFELSGDGVDEFDVTAGLFNNASFDAFAA